MEWFILLKTYNFLLFLVHFFNNFLIKSFSLDSSDLISQLLSERVVPNWNSLLRSMRSQNPVSSRFHALRHQKSNFYFWNKFFSSSSNQRIETKQWNFKNSTASQISISAELGMSFGGCFLSLALSTIRIETDLWIKNLTRHQTKICVLL